MVNGVSPMLYSNQQFSLPINIKLKNSKTMNNLSLVNSLLSLMHHNISESSTLTMPSGIEPLKQMMSYSVTPLGSLISSCITSSVCQDPHSSDHMKISVSDLRVVKCQLAKDGTEKMYL